MKLDAVAGGQLAALAHVATHPAAWRPLAGALRDRVFPSLTHPGFARLWRANLGTTTAYWMQSVAQGWLVVELTGSPFVLGLLAFFRSIPMLLLSPFGGVLADRQNRPRLLMVSQSMLAATALAIALLVALGRIEIWHLIVSSLVVGVTFTLSVPARHSMVSDLVPRHLVGNAVGLNSATQNGARVIGPAIAGFLIGVVGIAGAYFAQVASYVWSIWNVVGLRSADTRTRVSGSTFAILRDGFVYVRRTKVILAMMFLTLAPALFGMPIIMLLPAFVKQDLGGGAQELGHLAEHLRRRRPDRIDAGGGAFGLPLPRPRGLGHGPRLQPDGDRPRPHSLDADGRPRAGGFRLLSGRLHGREPDDSAAHGPQRDPRSRDVHLDDQLGSDAAGSTSTLRGGRTLGHSRRDAVWRGAEHRRRSGRDGLGA